MSSSSVVRVPAGGTINVRTGLLRGAGPQGPMGPVGPKGSKGDTGATGPQPIVTQRRAYLFTNAGVATGGDGTWYDAALPLVVSDAEPNDLLVDPGDNFGFQFLETGVYLGVLSVRFEQRTGTETGGTSANSRRVRIVDAANTGVIIAQGSVAASPTEPTILNIPVPITADASKKYKLQVYSDDISGVAVTDRSLRLYRVNAGPAGTQGPQGLVGLTGPQGPAGPTGSASSGFADYNGVQGVGTDTTADPGGTDLLTPDQQIPYPSGTQKPATPFFLKQALQFLERRIVAKYASAAARTTARSSRQVGELTYLDDSGSFQFREKNGNDRDIARVISSSSTPPAGAGQAAPGVLWVQI